MAFFNPKGRANYEPNSWGEGPRESPDRGFTSFAEEGTGAKRRARGHKFADHYSQARQFYISQTTVEQTHIKDAFVFELSKVMIPEIRARVVSHLLNIDADLAQDVADGLGLDLPEPSQAARPPVTDLAPSPALSILQNGPESFKGRKLGILVSDGADASLLHALEKAVEAEGGMVELVAPVIGGITDNDSGARGAKQKVNGGPSVLYDAVAILVSNEGCQLLAQEATAKDFVSDAFAHAKFIGYSAAARPLLEKAGVVHDQGCIALTNEDDVTDFVGRCRQLRHWQREQKVHVI